MTDVYACKSACKFGKTFNAYSLYVIQMNLQDWTFLKMMIKARKKNAVPTWTSHNIMMLLHLMVLKKKDFLCYMT